MRILLEAPILTKSGYGEHSRLVYNSIKDAENVEIFTKCVNWGQTSWISEYEDSLHESILKNANYVKNCEQTNTQPEYDMQIFVGILNEFEKRARYSVVVTAGIETDRVSAQWIIKTHQGVDKIIVPSEHAKAGFGSTSYHFKNETTGDEGILECRSPIAVVPYPVKEVSTSDIDLQLTTEFNFLNIALLGPRKNLENSVEWFLQEFKDHDDVGYVIKTAKAKSSVMDRIDTLRHVSSIIKKYPDSKCKVYLLHGNLTESEIHSLYVHPKIKALISTTCGEGFGLPIFEAAYSALPVVATDWSAHTEYLTAPYKENGKVKQKKLFSRINFTLSQVPDSVVWDGVLVKESMWAYADPSSYRKHIKKVYKNYGMYKKWAIALQKNILEKYKKDEVEKQMRDAIFSKIPQPSAHEDKMEIITI